MEAFRNGTLPVGLKRPVVVPSAHVLGNRLSIPPVDFLVVELAQESAGMPSLALPVENVRYVSTFADEDADFPEPSQPQ